MLDQGAIGAFENSGRGERTLLPCDPFSGAKDTYITGLVPYRMVPDPKLHINPTNTVKMHFASKAVKELTRRMIFFFTPQEIRCNIALGMQASVFIIPSAFVRVLLFV